MRPAIFGCPGLFGAGIISSTCEIARFWNIDAARTNGSMQSTFKTSAGEKPSCRSPSPTTEKAVAKLPVLTDGDVSTPRPDSDPHGVQTIIEDALRTAGLMR
jgi:hypothetical protein